MSRARRWTFTINNPIVSNAELERDCQPYRYLCFQLEQGEDGTPHFQGISPLAQSPLL